jgi:hypothetical protein
VKKLVLALAIAAGLMADAASATPNPKGYVLGLQSMPTGFSIKSTKAVPLAAAAKESDYPVAELKSWGYISGYEADYTRDVTLTDMVSGAIEIESTASIYKNESGAAKDDIDSSTCDVGRCTGLGVHGVRDAGPPVQRSNRGGGGRFASRGADRLAPGPAEQSC